MALPFAIPDYNATVQKRELAELFLPLGIVL